MRVVIPYRHDINEGQELRYAIRSLIRYFTPFSGIVLIGDKPKWYNGEHVDCRDIIGNKEWSIVNKILQSPDEDFLYSNDDYFALQPFGADLPNYYQGKLSEYKPQGNYISRVRNAMQIYPDGLMYDIHCPMVINLTVYREANDLDRNREYLCKSMYGNVVGKGVYIKDYKLRYRQELDTAKPFFSTTEHTCKYINFEALYPIKSEYEY